MKKKRKPSIVQHSIHRKDNESSEKKIHPLEQNKIEKSRIQKYETLKYFAKKLSKIFKTAFMKTILTVMQKNCRKFLRPHL